MDSAASSSSLSASCLPTRINCSYLALSPTLTLMLPMGFHRIQDRRGLSLLSMSTSIVCKSAPVP